MIMRVSHCHSHISKNIIYQHEVYGKFLHSVGRLLLFGSPILQPRSVDPRRLSGSVQLYPEPTPLTNCTLSYCPSAPPPKSSSAFLPAPPLYFKPFTLTKLSSSVLSKCPSQRSLFLRITVDIPSAPTSF